LSNLLFILGVSGGFVLLGSALSGDDDELVMAGGNGKISSGSVCVDASVTIVVAWTALWDTDLLELPFLLPVDVDGNRGSSCCRSTRMSFHGTADVAGWSSSFPSGRGCRLGDCYGLCSGSSDSFLFLTVFAGGMKSRGPTERLAPVVEGRLNGSPRWSRADWTARPDLEKADLTARFPTTCAVRAKAAGAPHYWRGPCSRLTSPMLRQGLVCQAHLTQRVLVFTCELFLAV